MRDTPTTAATIAAVSRWQHLARPDRAPPARARDPRRADAALHRAVPRPARPPTPATSSGQRSSTPPCRWCFVAVGQTIVVLTRGLDLSVGGVIDALQRLVATHMHDGPRQHARLEPDPGDRRGRRPHQRRARRLRTAAADPRHPRDALDLPGARDQGPAGAGRRRSRSPTRRSLANPNGPWGLVFVASWSSLWLVFRRTTVRRRHVRDRQRRGRGARARHAGAARRRSAPTSVSGMFAAAGGLFFAATTTAGDATSGDVVHPDLDRRRRPRRDQLLRRARQRDRHHRRRVRPHAPRRTSSSSRDIDPLYQSFFQGLFLVVAVLLGALVGRLVREAT